MKINQYTFFKRIILQATKSLLRNKFINAMTVIALTLIFILVHITSAFTFFTEKVLHNLEKKVDLGVFFNDNVSQRQIDDFLLELKQKKHRQEIINFTYFSREEALQEFEKKFPGRSVFLKRYGLSNPLVPMVEILPQENKLYELLDFLHHKRLAPIINQEFLRKNQEDKKRIENFISAASFIENAGSGILAFFLIISSGLIFYTISTIAYRHGKEIFIMRLVGARFSYIRGPFVIEGIILALSAFLISLSIASFLFSVFFMRMKNLFPDPNLQKTFTQYASEVLNVFSYNVFFIGLLILCFAFIGSFLAIEKFLHKETIT